MDKLDAELITPLGDNLLINLHKEKMSPGGIILVSDKLNEQNSMKGTVLKAGPGAKDKNGNRLPMSVKEGDEVILHFQGPVSLGRLRIAHSELQEGWETMIMVSESQVLAVLEPECAAPKCCGGGCHSVAS